MAEQDPRLSLTKKQQEALDTFKLNVADMLTNEQNNARYLLRWLKARNYDVAKSENMFRKSMAWRKEWGADTIRKDFTPPEALVKYYPGGFIGTDTHGIPIYFLPIGKLDIKGMSLSAKRSDLIRFHIYMLEAMADRLKEETQKSDKIIDQLHCIEDMDGFGLKNMFQPGMDIIWEVFGMMEANYPELLNQLYVINVIYKMIKPILSKETQAKVHVYAGGWKEKMQDLVDIAILPKYMGGQATDPDGDPRCTQKVCPGGIVPTSYYVKDNITIDEENIQKVTVKKGSSFNVETTIEKPGQFIKWVFWTEKNDIKYSLLYKQSPDAQEVVKPEARCSCNLVPEDGFLECHRPGIYILKFDNGYTKLHSKRLHYYVDVVDTVFPESALDEDGTS